MITYIIGYRHSDERYSNISKVIEWLLTISNIKIVIVEQDDRIKFVNKWGVEHIFIYNNGEYNRSWSFNVGFKNFDSEVYAFGDSDLIMDTDEFMDSINQMDNFDVVSPYSSVLDLTEEESKLCIDNWVGIRRFGRGENDNQKINVCGGLVLFTKESYIKVGGFCELFEGWGGEDDFQTMKINLLGLKVKEMSYRIYHLFHTRVSLNIKYYHKNLYILNTASKLNRNEMRVHINETLPTMGNKSKYE